MAGPAIEGLLASHDDNEITATWRNASDSGYYRVQTRPLDGEWPAPEWRGTGALEFTGTSGEYVEVPDASTLDPGESLSVWVAPNRVGSTGGAVSPGIVAGAETGNWNGYLSFRNTESFQSPEGGELEVQLSLDGDDGGGGTSDEFLYTPGEPVSICVAIENDGTVQYYVNGEDMGTGGATINAMTMGYLGVGYPGVPDDGTFNGIYDEFRHHNSILTQEQAEKHYNNRPVYTTGEIYYTFDSGTGSDIHDEYFSQDGTLSGASRVEHQYNDYAIVSNETTNHTFPNKPEGRFYQIRVRTETSSGLGPWTRPVLNYTDGDEITRVLAGGLPGYYPGSDESSNYDLLEPIGKHLGESGNDITRIEDASSVEEARSIAELEELGKMVDTAPLENEPLEHYRARLIAEFAVSSGAGTIRSLIETAAGILDVSADQIDFNEPAGGERGTAQVGLPGQQLEELGLSESFLIDILDQLVAAGYRLTAQVIGTFTYINPTDYASNAHDPDRGYDGLTEGGDPKDNGGTYAGLIT